MLPAAALSTPREARFQELKASLHAAVGVSGALAERLVPTGIAALDRLLGGGLPAGSLVTLEGRGSAGCHSIAASLLAQATHRGLGAVIDDGELYPPSLEAAGVRLDRLLVVPAPTPLLAARAADLLLRSRVARVIVMHAAALRAAVWARLAQVAHRTGGVLVVLAHRVMPEVQSLAAVRLGCSFERAIVRGTHGLWSTFSGFEARAELRKHKRAAGGAFAHLEAVLPA
ncbi:MAG: hypothetical protein KGN02_11165 [bacterium]|nr:hypothetical protein [bacterium]